jgi:hypothetical protein
MSTVFRDPEWTARLFVMASIPESATWSFVPTCTLCPRDPPPCTGCPSFRRGN